jgi:hypothetical protein
MSTSQFMQDIPAELIGMLAGMLDDKDLLATRTTCRELRNGTAFEFCQRYLDLVEISGTSDSVLALIGLLSSPNLPHAQQTVRKLVVSAPSLRPLEDHQEPDSRDVTRLLLAMPKLTTVKLADDTNLAESFRTARSAPFFLASIAQLRSSMRRLDLFAVQLHGDLLADMLQTHSNDLHVVSFNLVTLDSLPAWQQVLKILLSARIRRIDLAWLQYVDPEGRIEYVTFPRKLRAK